MNLSKLAAMSLEIPDFDMDDFVVERAYMNAANHVTVGRLTICHINRKASAEDDSSFADGNTNSARGTIISTIYWLIGGERLRITCIQEYRYCINGHSGGVAECNSESINWILSPSEMKLTEEEMDYIRTASKIASNSAHIDVVTAYEDVNYPLPRIFIDHICNELDLEDSNYKVAEKKTWNEWIYVEAEEAEARRKLISERPKSSKLTF